MLELTMNFVEVEKKWQKYWDENRELYLAKEGSTKEKKYILVEFPYPSGSGLHVGHAFSFTGGDVYARFERMKGYEVIFPMGWDAFGLPTENYAIKTKQKPQKVTKDNTDKFRDQMKRLAFSFDWSREVNTSIPEYYKWTQWIFIKLFENGLAEKQEMPINWCPSCKIGLANEEVVDGKCERCGAEVSKRTISQWVVKITKYADKLIEGLEKTDFIEKVKMSQINWIGRSEGARIKFQISNDNFQTISNSQITKELEVFTTRPDTIYGATFMVISPEHPLSLELGTNNEAIKKYQQEARKKSDLERTELNKEKTGVFSGLYAINPINSKRMPIWISDFVLASYGTGAIMSVPAHDERDYAFAKKFGLEIIEVINEEGKLINSFELNGLTIEEAKQKIFSLGIGEKTCNYHLRDWIFSRQHYWGEPIPMVFCKECARHGGQGWVTEKLENLPIVLPEVDAYEPTDDGKSPLSKIENFVKCKCPKCGGEATRETDTMPNWAGSDWYFLRYLDPSNDTVFCSPERIKKWMPVDVYIGGDEHNTLHLLYSRFIYKFLVDIGEIPKEVAEPYYRRMSHGVILGPDNQRMSKSRGNVIVPEVVADKYGVDVVRAYLMFMGPFEGTMAWNEKTLMGVKRFLDRFESLLDNQITKGYASSNGADVIINKTIDKMEKEYRSFGFNTAIAKMMECINEINTQKLELSKAEIEKMLLMMAPVTPYVAEEWWNKVGNSGSIHQQSWPEVEKKFLVEKEIKIPVAINGKVRCQIVVENEEGIIEIAKKEALKWIEGKEVVKEIYVPNRMVNLVIK